ncbi:MAG TPA: hypothetical protein VMU06_10525 [Stellaceae bacterium]|nr:hypothetical protein [Stellaceae bacterium]
MTTDDGAAAASLEDIARIERRTREALVYGRSGAILILWGVLTAAGYLLEHFNPADAGWQWLAINSLGFAATVLLLWRPPLSRDGRLRNWRLPVALLVLILYGLIWSHLLWPVELRGLSAFWPTLFMFGYVVAGLWIGRFFTLCGLAVTALTLAAYRWAGPWFPLSMAAVEGAALLAGGLWLRSVGVR